ncbi:peptidoglycan editing factor PgeF [Patescibacteria group bacterium]
MHQKNKDGVYKSSLLSHRKNIIHGYSSKKLGDMRKVEIRKKFFLSQNIIEKPIVWQNQKHGSIVHIVGEEVEKNVKVNADSTVYKSLKNTRKKPVLTVHVADCVPIILADYAKLVIGICHAGWRGTLSHIVTKTVKTMIKKGASIEHILVSIGPSIGKCCYHVAKKRGDMFNKEFKESKQIVMSKNQKTYLNLPLANYTDLLNIGIPKKNIDLTRLCTSCANDEFFSFRKDKKNSFGEIIGFVAINV